MLMFQFDNSKLYITNTVNTFPSVQNSKPFLLLFYMYFFTTYGFGKTIIAKKNAPQKNLAESNYFLNHSSIFLFRKESIRTH